MPSFTHGRLTMAIHLYGEGPLPLVTFHGFDRTGHDFKVFGPALGRQCTIHAFDLPYHGHSPAPVGESPITPEEFTSFFTAYGTHIDNGPMALLGYSLGGRLALSLLERCPALWSYIFLVAPDGLVPQPWYRGMAQYAWGRWVYRKFIDHPGGIHALIHFLFRMQLIGERMHRFLMGHSDSRKARELLHDVWVSFRLIEPKLERVAENLRDEELPLHLFVGQNDRVIKPAQAQHLQVLAPEQVHVHLLTTGHRMLTAELGEAIAGELRRGSEDRCPTAFQPVE